MDTKEKNRNENDFKGILNLLQSKTFKFISSFSCIGILIIFATSIINIEENKFYVIANAMNMFISIVVGIVAMVMSIISLFFSFYNTKQSYDAHDDYLEKFININNALEQSLKKQEEYTNSLSQLSSKIERIEDKISSKFDKMYDMLSALDSQNFNHLETQVPSWKEFRDDATDNEGMSWDEM